MADSWRIGRPKGSSYKAWTSHEILKLRSLYPRAPWEEINRSLPGRTKSSIVSTAQNLKIKRLRVRKRVINPGTNRLVAHLIEQRFDQGRALAHLAQEAGLSKQGMENLESGKVKPRMDTLIAWGESLGFELQWVKAGQQVVQVKTQWYDQIRYNETDRTYTYKHVTTPPMTGFELRFMRHFMKHVGHVQTRDQIHFAIYGDDEEGGPAMKIVDVMVCKLRPKLNVIGIDIANSWGEGYFIRDGVELSKMRKKWHDRKPKPKMIAAA